MTPKPANRGESIAICTSRASVTQEILAKYDVVLAVGEVTCIKHRSVPTDDVSVTVFGLLGDEVMEAVDAQNEAAELRRHAAVLVEALGDAWWVKAGDAFSGLRGLVTSIDAEEAPRTPRN